MANETDPLISGTQQTDYSGGALINNPDFGRSRDDDQEAVQLPESQRSRAQLAKLIFPMTIGIFLAAMDQTLVVASYAVIGSELDQLQNTSWIATGYMLTLASFQPLYGKLSDIFGRKACLIFAYSVFALGCLWCGFARTMNELIAARTFAGIGGGGMTTVVSIVCSDIVPLRSRGTWQGVLNVVFAIGGATGAPLGGFLADSIGWRWSFLLQVPVTILAIISVSLALDLPKMDNSDLVGKLKRVDFAGAAALVSMTFALLLGLDRGGNFSWRDNVTIISLALFVALFALFALIETKLAKEPFAPSRIILNRSLIAGYLVNFFGLAAGLTTLFDVSLYLQAALGKTASEAGLWLLPSIVAAVLGSIAGGLVMQATGSYYVLTVAAYMLLLLGTAILPLVTGAVTHSVVGILVGLVLLSLGNGMGITTSLIALISNAGAEDQAIATAVSYLFRSLGSVVGLSIGSTLVQDTFRKCLRARLSGQDVDEIVRRVRESLDYIATLDPSTQAIVRGSYEDAIRSALWFTFGLAACAAMSSVFIREKPLGPKR